MRTEVEEIPFELAVVEAVTDEGVVRLRWPHGREDTLRIPLEQVPRFKRLIGHRELATEILARP